MSDGEEDEPWKEWRPFLTDLPVELSPWAPGDLRQMLTVLRLQAASLQATLDEMRARLDDMVLLAGRGMFQLEDERPAGNGSDAALAAPEPGAYEG